MHRFFEENIRLELDATCDQMYHLALNTTREQEQQMQRSHAEEIQATKKHFDRQVRDDIATLQADVNS